MIKIDIFKSGYFVKGIDYKYFIPEQINDHWSWDDRELTRLIEK